MFIVFNKQLHQNLWALWKNCMYLYIYCNFTCTSPARTEPLFSLSLSLSLLCVCKEPLGQWGYAYISQWSLTKDGSGWLMVVGDLFKPERFTFASPRVPTCPLNSDQHMHSSFTHYLSVLYGTEWFHFFLRQQRSWRFTISMPPKQLKGVRPGRSWKERVESRVESRVQHFLAITFLCLHSVVFVFVCVPFLLSELKNTC